MNKAGKSPLVILFVLLIYVVLVYIVIKFWTYSIRIDNALITYLALISAIIWWGILLWALHHTAYQLISLFNTNNKKENSEIYKRVAIAIVYPTYNDLDEEALKSCLNQNFKDFHVYICDDSTSKKYRDRIDEIERKYSNCTISRRNDDDRKGFKAGNLNYAIRNKITQEWICLVDSDQFLESDYLSNISKTIPKNHSDIAYLQAKNEPRTITDMSDFQTVMKDEISLYYNRDLYNRNKYGFVPLLGHGALINRNIFTELNGFPEVVSEDFAYALVAASKGYKNYYVKNVISYESYPYDFGAFVTRLSKFSGASAELIRKIIPNFLFSKNVSFTEKWDFTVMLFWYILMPLIVVNGFISAYVTHYFWINKIPYIHPILPYIYTYMLLTLIVIIISSQKNNIKTSLKFYFWTSAIYSSTLPISGFYFLKGLFVKPIFTVTPKEKKTNGINKVLIFLVVILGVAGIIFSLIYWSPFSWFLLGHSVSYILFPLFINLNEDKLLCRLTKRVLIYLPGILMIISLIALWFFII
jgi:glycosyltransferase involved in cell wall biosynthesis